MLFLLQLDFFFGPQVLFYDAENSYDFNNHVKLMARAIIMKLGVRVKWQLGKFMHTTRTLLVSVF